MNSENKYLWPTQVQIERYIKSADAELGPESSDEWVETVRHILREIISGRAKVSYGMLYSWGGGSGSICDKGCCWQIVPGASDLITERCTACGSMRSRPLTFVGSIC